MAAEQDRSAPGPWERQENTQSSQEAEIQAKTCSHKRKAPEPAAASDTDDAGASVIAKVPKIGDVTPSPGLHLARSEEIDHLSDPLESNVLPPNLTDVADHFAADVDQLSANARDHNGEDSDSSNTSSDSEADDHDISVVLANLRCPIEKIVRKPTKWLRHQRKHGIDVFLVMKHVQHDLSSLTRIVKIPNEFQVSYAPTVFVRERSDPEAAARSTLFNDFLWLTCYRMTMALHTVLTALVETRIGSAMMLGRPKLSHVNTIEDVCTLIEQSNKVLVLTGAGISVSAGIPDFRSKGGIYRRLAEQYGMPEPECMFDIHYFRAHPEIFYSFAKELWPYSDPARPQQVPFKPTPTHKFIAALDKHGKLLRNYTQNIDTLEQIAGISEEKIVQCHGSFSKATCVTCRTQVPGIELHDAVVNQRVPYCKVCWPEGHPSQHEFSELKSTSLTESTSPLNPQTAPAEPPASSVNTEPAAGAGDVNQELKQRLAVANSHTSSPKLDARDDPSYGVMKPDIVFFHENLSADFHHQIDIDMEEVDLVLVMGSSLKVAPVCTMVNAINPSVPSILINKELAGQPNKFDVELLGYSDSIVSHIARRLGWSPGLQQSGSPSKLEHEYTFLPPSRYLFEGYSDPSPADEEPDSAPPVSTVDAASAMTPSPASPMTAAISNQTQDQVL